jgi:hypothetical protein
MMIFSVPRLLEDTRPLECKSPWEEDGREGVMPRMDYHENLLQDWTEP